MEGEEGWKFLIRIMEGEEREWIEEIVSSRRGERGSCCKMIKRSEEVICLFFAFSRRREKLTLRMVSVLWFWG